MVYATVHDLTAHLPADLTVPTDAARLLDRASEVIAEIMTRAVYQTDGSWTATDPLVVATIVRAECLQAAWWIETGDEQGATSGVTSASSGGGPSWGGAVQSVAPRAVTVLRTAVDSSGCPLMSGPWMW